MTVRIGVDTGGTFTDVVLYDAATGEIHITKTPSTPPNFDEGVLTGIDKIIEKTDTEPSTVSFLSHGTTVGTNAVLEGDIPDLGLITNEGLRDVLEIGDQTRPELYNLQVDKPPALVPRRLRREVPGRFDSAGEIIDPFDETQARTVVESLAEADVDSIVVSLLFSYLEDDHERRVGEIIERVDPELDYALSSAVYPERREYDRTVTTVLNEAVKIRIQDYLDRLDTGIADRGLDVPLTVMHSGGGIFGTTQATEFAIRTVLSGPAAGAVATRDVCQTEALENVIGLDMGGTSTDVSVVEDGDIVRSTAGEINDLPINTPMIDIHTVGAGGGSIVWIDEGGGLRVGPQSAGADPGPICYDRGGTEPTVTDANLVLGRIDPDAFLEGNMSTAAQRARDRFRTEIADPLGESLEEAAMSVLKVANAKMSRQIRKVTVERGQDPASFSLVAFGGAGPLQAAAVGRQMEMDSIVLPQSPGVFSARGLLLADIRLDESQASHSTRPDAEIARSQFESMEATLVERFDEQGFDRREVDVEYAIDARYEGQSYERTVALAGETVTEETLGATVERFHDVHEQLYGYSMPNEPVELVALRSTGTVETAPLEAQSVDADVDAVRTERKVYFEGGFRTTPIYRRSGLSVGQQLEGPAIIEEPGCTSLLPPGTTANVTEDGNVIVTL
ncbi:hydantoinase/oxoprolinase family protein [Natronorubrum texcoconense]|uniref:N-methylhydantoinase A n=1 Tax=Natronorubrum texcoconense TaxID=1095776 RepID=A0A1G9D1A9_9EURY|nr:hydantoinase/oxoprolinase family protein [Natronorubrum texcoconense]SDK57494.1 N-methylhydantoinase A [Natronorubrum texcoconense]